MTNREKFKQIFGVDIEDFTSIKWEAKYGKLKIYQATMRTNKVCRYDEQKIYRVIKVAGKSRLDARKNAIEILGSDYRRYTTGTPMYALDIELIQEGANE